MACREEVSEIDLIENEISYNYTKDGLEEYQNPQFAVQGNNFMDGYF